MEYLALIEQLKKDGYLKTDAIIEAFKKMHRAEFLPQEYKHQAHLDIPLPIYFEQTISQPLTVAFMTELLEPEAGEKILEVGTGSGWQAAILSYIVGESGLVYTTEIIPGLVEFAEKNLKKLNIKNVKVLLADGSQGLADHAPYDKIIVAAAAPSIPAPLRDQLKVGGKMVIPIGDFFQKMTLVEKVGADEIKIENKGDFRFVPLKGKYGWQ